MEKLKVDRLAEKPIYRQIEERIEYAIRKNIIVSGDVVPSPKVLSRHLSVNELTVRRAIKSLVDRNMLLSRQGRGTFVAGDVNLKSVLWVCGYDIFSGDISPFYTHFLRSCLDHCSEKDLVMEHAWLSTDRPIDSKKYCNFRSTQDYSGYIFVGCGETHPLLEYVARNGLNYVNVTSGEVRSRRVVHNQAQAVQLGLDCLAGFGHQHAVVISASDHLWKDSTLCKGMKVQHVVSSQCSRFSEVEKEGYQLMCQLLLGDDDPLGFFIFDDVIARGASRAILEHAQDRRERVDLVVICGDQEIVPLGLRTTYIIQNNKEISDQAVRILADQIEGRGSEPDYYVSKFEVMYPSK